MIACVRGEAPALIARHGPDIGRDYARRRGEDGAYRFRWPQREGQSLFAVALAALRDMTGRRCSYCDAQHLDATGQSQIDHFRPKSRREFYELVCAWGNLFLACKACNDAKADRWSDLLLRPDEPGYSFERYFAYEARTDSLLVNEVATQEDRARAQYTIEVFDLNRHDLRSARGQVRRLLRAASDEDRAETGFRYLRSVVHP